MRWSTVDLGYLVQRVKDSLLQYPGVHFLRLFLLRRTALHFFLGITTVSQCLLMQKRLETALRYYLLLRLEPPFDTHGGKLFELLLVEGHVFFLFVGRVLQRKVGHNSDFRGCRAESLFMGAENGGLGRETRVGWVGEVGEVGGEQIFDDLELSLINPEFEPLGEGKSAFFCGLSGLRGSLRRFGTR